MFAVSRNCIKMLKMGEILCGSVLRPFSKKSKLERNLVLKERHVMLNNYFRKEYSSNADAEIENVEKEINFDAIANGDKDLEHKLKVLVLEAEVMRQEGKAIPSSAYLKEKHWKELLNLPTRTSRKRYLEYLFKLSKKEENRQAKKTKKRLLYEEFKSQKDLEEKAPESIEEFALKYDLQHNNLFLRVYDTTMNQMYNNRLIQAMMFGQKLVVDCGYDENMTKRENLYCAKQLMLLFAENRNHDDPFDLYFCNANKDGLLVRELNKFIPSLYEPAFPLNMYEGSYLDLFPKEQLVYLTPHCHTEMQEFDHDAVYIIGGIVDKINNQPLSLAKAKKEGLKMAKFPLDKYLEWGSGSGKSLTLNQVTSILNDIKVTGDWMHSLRHVPRRKLQDFSLGSNIYKAADKLRYDRPTREKWVPASNLGRGNLTFNSHIKEEDKERSVDEKERIVNVKSIMND